MNESKLRRFLDRASGAPTFINEGCRISGVVSGGGDYRICGEVDGDCDVDGTVSLARDGLWRGTIKADNVVVSGRVEGDIIASGMVEIAESARIAGTVTGTVIAVARGAVVEGSMKTTDRPGPAGRGEKRGRGG
ncbi:MAG: polymer-forming cytoskeletal protein [Proteobacteria bacterium]|nr:polymer-forming cytoskeletal protein [Pseudomonadota bacterium]